MSDHIEMQAIETRISRRVLKSVDDYSDNAAIDAAITEQLMRCTKRELALYARIFVEAKVKAEIREITAEAERRAQEAYWRTPEGMQSLADERERAMIKRELQEERDRRHQDELQRKLNEIDERMHRQMNDAISRWAHEMRIQWTEELMDSVFALGDGTSVKWGDATVAQHELRAEQLMKHAAGTAQSAARHRKAVEDMRAVGANTLREMLAVGVAA